MEIGDGCRSGDGGIYDSNNYGSNGKYSVKGLKIMGFDSPLEML